MKNAEPHPLYGHTGRRAVTIIVVAGLLIMVLSTVEGGPGAIRPAVRTPALQNTALTVAAARSTRSSRVGMKLLQFAMGATQAVTYQGLQVVSWRASDRASDWLAVTSSTAYLKVQHDTGQSAGEFGLTPRLLTLLGTHYIVRYAGDGQADGRSAQVVEVLWPDGTLAAKFWLDRATMLPLRRQLFDTQANLVSQEDLDKLQLGTFSPARTAKTMTGATGPVRAGPMAIIDGTPGLAAGQRAKAATPARAKPAATASAAAQGTWTGSASTVRLATLSSDGWPALPTAMPGGLTEYGITEATASGQPYVQVDYTDGLSVVSVALQRGHLPTRLPKWRTTNLTGNPLYSTASNGEPALTWTSQGYVYTVVAGAPAPVIAGVVNQLPHQAAPGLWGRMNRGAHRLLRIVNPFR